jgi:Protein of unknown function (DUF2971)
VWPAEYSAATVFVTIGITRIDRMEAIVYKYRSFNDRSKRILNTNAVWYSHPSELNDTYEFSVPLYVPLGPSDIVAHYRKRFNIDSAAPRLLRNMIEFNGGGAAPIDPEFVNSFINASDDKLSLWCICAVHYLADRGMDDDAIAAKLNLKESTLLRENLVARLRRAYSDNQEVGRTAGIFSLSRHYADPLLWAHYADSARGLCIGMHFTPDDVSNHPVVPMLVEYHKEPPMIDADKFFNRAYDSVSEALPLFYASKSAAWSHEEEIRFFATRGNCEYPWIGRIAEVIVGEKMPEKDLYEVIEIVRSISAVKLFKMIKSPNSWDYIRYQLTF